MQFDCDIKNGSEIVIMGIPYTIELKEDSYDAAETHFGQISYAKGKIVLNSSLPPQLMRETLAHEMVHGMLLHMGREDLNNDEAFVQALGNAISQSFVPKVDWNKNTITFKSDGSIMLAPASFAHSSVEDVDKT